MTSPETGGELRAPALVEPDAHGQAALLLAESTLHMLVERGMLTAVDAAVVVQMAADVKQEVATAAGESAERMQASLDLLGRIAHSFAIDGEADADGNGRFGRR